MSVCPTIVAAELLRSVRGVFSRDVVERLVVIAMSGR